MSRIEDLESDSPYLNFEAETVEDAVTVFEHLSIANSNRGDHEAAAIYHDAAEFLERELVEGPDDEGLDEFDLKAGKAKRRAEDLSREIGDVIDRIETHRFVAPAFTRVNDPFDLEGDGR